MSRATVDLQGVRFFLGYGLIFFFQNILVVLSVTVVLFFVAVAAGADRARDRSRSSIALAYRYSHVSHPTLRDVQQKLADVATVAAGEHRRRPRRQGVRAGAGRAGEVRAALRGRLRADAAGRTGSARSTCR